MATTLEKVRRLVLAATGEEWGDDMMVTDVIVGYAEPGYPSDPDVVVVLGDWNPRHVAGVTRSRHDDESLPGRYDTDDKRVTLPSRLAAALERVGAEIEWCDEWYRCDDCYRAVRSTENSYSWKPSYVQFEDGISCHKCAIKMGEDALTDYVDNFARCLTWCEPAHVESFGFVKWEPGNEHTYESGWHPGQTDTPEPIFDEIKRQHPDADVVFFLDESSQFYITFSAYFRLPSDDES